MMDRLQCNAAYVVGRTRTATSPVSENRPGRMHSTAATATRLLPQAARTASL
jgi:hypothetical protein